MAKFSDFLDFGADEMFNAGDSFRSVASYLRTKAGLSFGNSQLQEFRKALDFTKDEGLWNYDRDKILRDRDFTPSSQLECGEYGIRVHFSGIDHKTDKIIQGHTFEITDKPETLGDFISTVIPSIKERALTNSDVTILSFSIGEGFRGEC